MSCSADDVARPFAITCFIILDRYNHACNNGSAGLGYWPWLDSFTDDHAKRTELMHRVFLTT